MESTTEASGSEHSKPQKAVYTVENDSEIVLWKKKRGLACRPWGFCTRLAIWILSIILMIYTVTGQNYSINQFSPLTTAYVEKWCDFWSRCDFVWKLIFDLNSFLTATKNRFVKRILAAATKIRICVQPKFVWKNESWSQRLKFVLDCDRFAAKHSFN